jgi:predicted ATPase
VLFPLVARAGALAEVDTVLTAARAGRGALVTVTGEPGIGKTRLAEAVADLAGAGQAQTRAGADRAADFEVIWTWCPAERSAVLRSGLVIRLPPFGQEDVASLVGTVTGAPPGPDLVTVIAERSGGNPLLAAELARQLGRQEANTSRARVRASRPSGPAPR